MQPADKPKKPRFNDARDRKTRLEKSVDDEVRALLRRVRVAGGSKAFIWKVHGGATGGGMPDLFFSAVLESGRRVSAWIELKRPGKKRNKLQEHRCAELVASGQTVFVADDAAIVRAWLAQVGAEIGEATT